MTSKSSTAAAVSASSSSSPLSIRLPLSSRAPLPASARVANTAATTAIAAAAAANSPAAAPAAAVVSYNSTVVDETPVRFLDWYTGLSSLQQTAFKTAVNPPLCGLTGLPVIDAVYFQGNDQVFERGPITAHVRAHGLIPRTSTTVTVDQILPSLKALGAIQRLPRTGLNEIFLQMAQRLARESWVHFRLYLQAAVQDIAHQVLSDPDLAPRQALETLFAVFRAQGEVVLS